MPEFVPGPALLAILDRFRGEELRGERMGFWLTRNAVTRLASAIRMDLELVPPAAGHRRFEFGLNARRELDLLHLDGRDVEAIRNAIREDLGEPAGR